MQALSDLVLDYLKIEGAVASGIATTESLAGGPPSVDLNYVMPTAKAAIVFALPLNQELIVDFLAKKDQHGCEKDYERTSSLGNGIAVKLANFLSQKGHPSVPLAVNEVYREDDSNDRFDMKPPVSLRYLAVASGVGSFGFSGNILTKEHGPAVILGGLVTEANLIATKPLDQSENYCDDCHLCSEGCVSGLLDTREKVTITMGGHKHSYAARKSILRCMYVCGGFTGLHPSGQWSTWSPGRFSIPQDDEGVASVFLASMEAYNKRPQGEGGRYHTMMEKKLYNVCANCQFVCSPDKEERIRRLNILTQSGVVVQNEDASLDAVSPEEAKQRLKKMDPERKAVYECDIKPVPNALELLRKSFKRK